MSQAPLDEFELEAIQAAMRGAAASPAQRAQAQHEDVRPLALIADDREAERARPAAIQIADRSIRLLKNRLKTYLRGAVEVDDTSVDVIDGSGLRDELRGSWFSCLTLPDRAVPALIAISGPIIPSVAAMLCGDSTSLGMSDKPPSAAAISIFQPVGEAICDSLAAAWAEEHSCTVNVEPEVEKIESTRRLFQDSDLVVSLVVSLTGSIRGKVRVLARPNTLVRNMPVPEAVPANAEEIDLALAGIPIDVSVELGTTKVTMRQLQRLEVGTVITLNRFVDDPLPIECAGVVKAFGHALVSRGCLAVQVDRVLLPMKKKTA